MRITACTEEQKRGFTLVEVMITVSIIGIISAALIYEYSKFDSQLLLRNLAYEIALEIRQAQAYGISVRGEEADFDIPYGVHFEAPGTEYLLFRDSGTDVYQFDAGDAILLSHTISRKNHIAQLCIENNCSASSLDVLFQRPEPDAIFSPSSNSDVRIIVSPISLEPGDPVRTVVVSVTGQISVE